jgi:hypothetical protein
MKFEFTWVDPSLVICRASGAASVKGYRAMMQALTSQPQFQPGVDVIIDHKKVEVSALTSVEIEQIAGSRVEFMGATAGRTAGVAAPGSPIRWGLAPMHQAHIDSFAGTEFRWFETLDKAMAWLRPSE